MLEALSLRTQQHCYKELPNCAILTMASEVIESVCKRTVISTKPVQPGKCNPLSVLDRLMEKNNVRIVYYYPFMGNREADGKLTKKLRESLSEVLTCFPKITGRLQKNQEGIWMIKCNDAGVRMVEARAKGSVEEWLTNVDREKELRLVYWEDMFYEPYFWSTFYVQLTEFEGGGLAIGLSCSHILADATCATMFIKAWADTTVTGIMNTPPFFHPLPPRRLGNKNHNHQPYTDLINHYKLAIQTSIPETNIGKHATVTVAFSDPMVRSCMSMAQIPEAPDLSSSSPFQALAGLFWVCVSKIKGMEEELINMSISLDMRKILGLDKGYFGNCMVYNKIHAEYSLDQNKLSVAARAIDEVITKMDNEGIMDLIEWLECDDQKQYLPLMNGYDLICANFENLESYSTIFEEGLAPSRVSYYVEPVFGIGQVLVLPSPPREGPLSRTVMVTLPQDEVIKLCEDDLMMRFCPTILMKIDRNY